MEQLGFRSELITSNDEKNILRLLKVAKKITKKWSSIKREFLKMGNYDLVRTFLILVGISKDAEIMRTLPHFVAEQVCRKKTLVNDALFWIEHFLILSLSEEQKFAPQIRPKPRQVPDGELDDRKKAELLGFTKKGIKQLKLKRGVPLIDFIERRIMYIVRNLPDYAIKHLFAGNPYALSLFLDKMNLVLDSETFEHWALGLARAVIPPFSQCPQYWIRYFCRESISAIELKSIGM